MAVDPWPHARHDRYHSVENARRLQPSRVSRRVGHAIQHLHATRVRSSEPDGEAECGCKVHRPMIFTKVMVMEGPNYPKMGPDAWKPDHLYFWFSKGEAYLFTKKGWAPWKQG